MREFELINAFFKQQSLQRPDVLLGIGDDAALVKIPSGEVLAITVDTLVEGIHFHPNANPYDIGYKALAVNLSDLAAMGAQPAWATLALTLPETNTDWLYEFSRGFFELAQVFNVQLIGGDTTRGPLTITIQMQGFTPENKALKRSAAKPGDLIYVTGTLGDAGCALQLGLNAPIELAQRLHRPFPRITEGLLLREIAHSAIDISDGLAADLNHILENSQVGAQLFIEQIPLSTELLTQISPQEAQQLALCAGDDYELCFTISPSKVNLLLETGISCTCIGQIESLPGLKIKNNNGEIINLVHLGYSHFDS
ncbi:MAG: Thiamine-monophosphate kinase [Legionellaceae bacterium]